MKRKKSSPPFRSSKQQWGSRNAGKIVWWRRSFAVNLTTRSWCLLCHTYGNGELEEKLAKLRTGSHSRSGPLQLAASARAIPFDSVANSRLFTKFTVFLRQHQFAYSTLLTLRYDTVRHDTSFGCFSHTYSNETKLSTRSCSLRTNENSDVQSCLTRFGDQ